MGQDNVMWGSVGVEGKPIQRSACCSGLVGLVAPM
jgi:hypothetical protein